MFLNFSESPLVLYENNLEAVNMKSTPIIIIYRSYFGKLFLVWKNPGMAGDNFQQPLQYTLHSDQQYSTLN